MVKAILSESDIRQRVGDRSFKRGKQYYHADAIKNPLRQDNILKAQCWGSRPQPYRLWVRLGQYGIEDGDCSCPVGDGGYCKHIAALLLTWLHANDLFFETAPLKTLLQQATKNDLIFIINRMIARYPELEELIFLPSANSHESQSAPNPDFIKKQVLQAINHSDSEFGNYGVASTIARDLELIMDQANAYREQGDWLNVALIIRTVVDVLCPRYTKLYDDDGELIDLFSVSSETLGNCLPHIQEPPARLAILESLTNIILLDIEVGGYGFADEAYGILIHQATKEEKSAVVEWVESALSSLSPIDTYGNNWELKTVGKLLIDLQVDTLTDAQYLDLCERTGQVRQLVARLLKRNRINDAISRSQAVSDFDLLSIADLFVTHGHDTVAEGLIWERMGTSNDSRLNEWLQKHAETHGNWQKAVEYAENRFWQRPDLLLFQEIRAIAEKSGDWPHRRLKLVKRLEKKQQYPLLTKVYLFEENVPAALVALEKGNEGLPRTWGQAPFAFRLSLEVAAAAEDTQPHESRRLYQQVAEYLIQLRSRNNYAQAAIYLRKVKELMAQLNASDAWEAYVTELKNQKPRLPALLDELRKAGL